ncbi:MAG: hypothetical protein KF816_06485 [Melioribacteraceae bacterium]|nr:hypothetical protein [Melioribacteraceae bacterium]
MANLEINAAELNKLINNYSPHEISELKIESNEILFNVAVEFMSKKIAIPIKIVFHELDRNKQIVKLKIELNSNSLLLPQAFKFFLTNFQEKVQSILPNGVSIQGALISVDINELNKLSNVKIKVEDVIYVPSKIRINFSFV